MKKRGFTLIELLAVIVVLAIIALITMPVITGVVEKTRKGAAKNSALNYVRAIELKIATDSLSGKNYEDKDDYAYDEIDTKAKGKLPTGGIYSLQKGIVTYANFCINNYVVTYENNKVEVGEKCIGSDLKRRASLKLSKTSAFLTYPAEDEIEIIENTSGGNLTCTTADSTIATCEINNGKLVIKSGKKEGHTTVTLTSEETSKYKEARVAILVSTEEGLLSINADGYSGVYDGEEHGIIVSSQDATIKYGTDGETYNLDASPKYSNVGEYTVYYEVTKEGYKTVKGSKTVSITKANGSIVAPTAKTLTYTGSAQELVNAGSSTTGTIQYKLGNGSYSTSIPTAIEAGEYTVYYKVVGDNNHNDVAEASINVTMIKRLQDVAQLGDYVIMTPTSTSSTVYTTGTSISKLDADISNVLNPSLMNVWRVIKINSDGTVEMVSEYVQGPITFKNPTSYLAYVKQLQDASKIYSNQKYVQSTKHIGYNGQTLTITTQSCSGLYPSRDTITTTTPDTLNSKPTNESIGGGDTLYYNDTQIITSVLGTLIAKDIADKNTPQSYYLASRKYVLFNTSTYPRTQLFLRYIDNYGVVKVSEIWWATSNCAVARTGTYNYYLRPIITLKPNLEVSGGNGSSEANAWTLK